MDIFSLWHKEHQASFTYVLLTQMDEQVSDINPRISAQLKTTLMPQKSRHCPTAVKARLKFLTIGEV